MDFYVDDPSPRPWKFRPEGYLVVILADVDEGERAEAALVAAGFASRDVKVYPGAQIVENFERYASRRTMTDKVVGSVVDDVEARDRYLAYARGGASALWLRLPDEAEASKALRVLADCRYLHARHYGAEKETDYRI
jgi:hypothetical protein